MFQLILSDDNNPCIYDDVGDRKYCVDDLDDLMELVDYVNELLIYIDDLKLHTVSGNIYHLQEIGGNLQELEDYDEKHSLVIDIDKADNKVLIDLLESLEERGDTYLQTSIILAKKLGFDSADEFLSAVENGFLY